MRASGEYPSPVHGVSTMPSSTVLYGYAKLQENLRSDPIEKLKRRPPLMHEGILSEVGVGDETRHVFTRNGVEHEVIVREDGTVVGMIDNVIQTTVGDLSPYVVAGDGSDIDLVTINDTTFALNRNKVVLMDPKTDQTEGEYLKVSYINVLTALNYGEVITLSIKDAAGTVIQTVTHTVPNIGSDLTNYDAADRARATAAVATALFNAVNASLVNKFHKSSTLSVSALTDEHITLEVESGQGTQSVVAINKVNSKTDGLPLFAVVGSLVEINPDPNTEKGAYFLKATRIAEVAAEVEGLEEVVWAEGRDPEQEYALNPETMPYTILFDDEGGVTVGQPELGWEERSAGNNLSVKVPKFVNKTIKRLGYMQSRLLVLTGSNCVTTRVDDIFNFWKASSIKLLVTDPVSVASNAVNIDTLEHLLPHNKDMLITGANAQFKISGASRLSPETGSLALTTSIEVDTLAKPVAMGNSIFFPTREGSNAGIVEYTGEKDTDQDKGKSVTDHVAGLLQGRITKMVANSTNEMLLVQTDGSPKNVLFVYEQFTNAKGEKKQQSWSKWIFQEGLDIMDINLEFNKLSVVSLLNGKLWKHAVYIESKRATESNTTIYLDNQVLLDTDGTTVTLPDNYDWDGSNIVVRGVGCDLPLFQVGYIYNAGEHTLTLAEDVSNGEVHVGLLTQARYQPYRPYRRNKDGKVQTEEKIRVSNVFIEVSDSYGVSVEVESKFYNANRMLFSSEFVGQTLVGVKEPFTGVYNYPFMKDADLAEILITTDGYLGLTITNLRWRGQYTRLTSTI
jgi:hypothetical protein